MKRLLWIVVLLVLGMCCLAEAQDPNEAGKPDVMVQTLGASDEVQVRAGLGNARSSWGLSILHEPSSDDKDQATAFGAYGLISTPIQLLDPDAIPGLWAGLTVRPFVDIDILYNPEADKAITVPGVGVLIEPLNTMSFVVRGLYPLAFDDDDEVNTTLDLNTLALQLGIQVRF
jgi:hypothetical protein